MFVLSVSESFLQRLFIFALSRRKKKRFAMKKKRELIITDDFGDISNVVFPEEINLLLPYADILLEPLLKSGNREKTYKGQK